MLGLELIPEFFGIQEPPPSVLLNTPPRYVPA